MDRTRKELQAQFKEREIVGGIYCIKNTLNGKILLKAAANLQGSLNRFEFSQKTGSCVERKLQYDWSRDGCGSFTCEVLEELKKGEAQTDDEFKADIAVLMDMWLEKLSDADFY